jgi:PAS domain S-box-containing protein
VKTRESCPIHAFCGSPRRFVRILVCVGFVLAGLAPADPTAAANDDPLLESWRWARFSIADGLPDECINALAEHPDGTVWVGTDAGVAWFDGWLWHPLPFAGEKSVEKVLSLTIDKSGTVWAVAGTSLYRGGTGGFEAVPLSGPLSGKDLDPLQLAALPDGGVLLLVLRKGGSEHALIRLAEGSIRSVPLPSGINGSAPPVLYQFTGGGIWILTEDGVFRRDGPGWSSPLPVGTDRISGTNSALASNAAGDVVASLSSHNSLRGVWEWSAGQPPRHIEQGSDFRLEKVAMAPSGDVVGTLLAGQVCVRRAGTWSELVRTPLGFRRINFFSFRENGDLWCGTERGLFLYRGSSTRWRNWVHTDQANAARRIHGILQASDGVFWIASAKRLVARRPDGSLSPRTPDESDQCTDATALGEGPDGEIWIGSGGFFMGVKCWNWRTRTWRWIKVDDTGQLVGLVHRIKRDRSGRLWLLSLAAELEHKLACSGAVYFVEDGRIVRWRPGEDLLPVRVYNMDEAEDGTLWFALWGGVACWKEGIWRRWTVKDHPDLSITSAIAVDPGGGAWAGQLRLGLFKINEDGTALKVRFPHDRRLDSVWDLAFDGANRLWITTEWGLACLNDGVWSCLGRDEGFDPIKAWPIVPIGNLLFVGTLGDGTQILDMDEADAPPPLVTFADPVVDGDEVVVTWSAHAYQGCRLSESIETRHRLDGSTWSAWSLARRARLPGLDSGGHLAEVQAKGLLGRTGMVVPSRFTVPGPFYARGVFLVPLGILAVLLVGTVLVAIVRFRRDARALRESEGRYRRLMEESSDAIVVTDGDGGIVETNRHARTLLEEDRSALVGRSLWKIMACGEKGVPDPNPREREVLEERGLLRRDGSSVPVEISAILLGDGRILAVIRDLTERKRLEEERITFERDIANSQRLESLGALAGGVAHDFNNLLTVILGHTEVVLEEMSGDSEVRDRLEQVISASEQASELTQQLLASTGQSTFAREPLQVNDLVRDMNLLLRSSIGKGVCLEVECGENVSAVVGNAGRLRQVLLNLIVNASEAIGDRKGRIVVSTGTATRDESPLVFFDHGLPPGSRWVWIAVRDNGPGLSEEDRSQVFEPFFSTKAAGRGLGLAAVHGIVSAHGGTIRAAAASGGGAIFIIALPATDRKIASASRPDERQDVKGKGTILVVDDEKYILHLVETILTKRGYEGITAASGKEGLALFENRGEEIDGVLIDLTMPGMSGLELLKALRHRRPDLPVVLMSGWNRKPLPGELEGVKNVIFLHKPFKSDEFSRALEESFTKKVVRRPPELFGTSK